MQYSNYNDYINNINNPGINYMNQVYTNSPYINDTYIDYRKSITMPKKIGAGDRTLYTRADGLSRVCLNWDLSLGSDIDVLGSSIENGRVICASSPQAASARRK